MGRIVNNRPTADETLHFLLPGNTNIVTGDPENINHSESGRHTFNIGQIAPTSFSTCAAPQVPPIGAFHQQENGYLFDIRLSSDITVFHSSSSIQFSMQNLPSSGMNLNHSSHTVASIVESEMGIVSADYHPKISATRF